MKRTRTRLPGCPFSEREDAFSVKRFFAWLETKAYKMHIRVLLSRYRSYTECSACHGARLKLEALYWRIGEPALNIRDVMLLPLDQALKFFHELRLPAALDEATELLRLADRECELPLAGDEDGLSKGQALDATGNVNANV